MWPVPGPLYRFKDVLAQPFTANLAIVAFDKGILLWICGLNVFNVNAAPRGPSHQLAADIFRPVAPSETC